MPSHIHAIPILSDNYVWTIIEPNSKSAMIVDPGEAKPVLKYLRDNDLNLVGILITHHHWDHTNGLVEVAKAYDCPVYGPKTEKIRGVTQPVGEGDQFHVDAMNLDFKVLDIPGHTLGHVAYIGDNALFCGDTLFSGGCGRLFEGTYEQLYSSLQKLAALPDDTKVYCAHEYTKRNLQFALKIEPDNKNTARYLEQVEDCMTKQRPTLPSNIALEKKINPFLRCAEKKVIQCVKQNTRTPSTLPLAVFTELRVLKDGF